MFTSPSSFCLFPIKFASCHQVLKPPPPISSPPPTSSCCRFTAKNHSHHGQSKWFSVSCQLPCFMYFYSQSVFNLLCPLLCCPMPNDSLIWLSIQEPCFTSLPFPSPYHA
ncbi:hypothetical protein BsWGS_19055 [Bradybaena similaris]